MYYFFLGPCIIYTIDHLVTVVTKKVEVPVLKAELLPSGMHNSLKNVYIILELDNEFSSVEK